MRAIKRRHFLLGTAGAAGALIVGWLAAPPRQRLLPRHPFPAAPGETALNGWVKVAGDDTATVMMSQAEMGQGAAPRPGAVRASARCSRPGYAFSIDGYAFSRLDLPVRIGIY